jgi:hypothetical protein
MYIIRNKNITYLGNNKKLQKNKLTTQDKVSLFLAEILQNKL